MFVFFIEAVISQLTAYYVNLGLIFRPILVEQLTIIKVKLVFFIY